MSEEAAETEATIEPAVHLTVTPEGLRIDSDMSVSDVYFVLGQGQKMILDELFA